MAISEKQALQKMVSRGLLEPANAEIIMRLARSAPSAVQSIGEAELQGLALLLDKSGSMKRYQQAVIQGQHHLLNSLLGSTASTYIYLGQLLFNHKVDYFQDPSEFRDPSRPKMAHESTRLLDETNYVPDGKTILYDAIVHGIAMLAPLIDMAKEVRATFLARIGVLTDGHDEGSVTEPEELKKIIELLLENQVLEGITLVGIGSYDYRTMAKSIGITDVIQADADPASIRRSFDLLSSRTLGDRT